MLVLNSRGWVPGHTITRNKGTLLFIKTKESLRMHLKEVQESKRSTRRRRVDKDDGKMGPVLENEDTWVIFIFFSVYIYFFICLNFSYQPIFIFWPKFSI